MRTESAPWPAADLIGGAPFLDFANTVGGRTKSREADRLTSYPTLVGWARATALVSAAEAETLLAAAARDTAGAERCLQEARAFRESLYCLLSRVAAGAEPAAPDLGKVNDV